jgi:hypothetical protein
MFFGGNTAARRARRSDADSGPGVGKRAARTGALILTAGAGIGSLALGGMAWTTPETVAGQRPIQVQQWAGMTYQAGAPRSAAYPTGKLRTNDPVFLRLIRTLKVTVAYRASLTGLNRSGSTQSATGTGTSIEGLRGTRRVTAELRSTNGWHRGFELLPRADFTGDGFKAVAPLDLKHVKAMVTGLTKASGVHNGTFTLSVRSEIAVTGAVPGPGTAVRDSFFPELTFAYDGKQLHLIEPATPASADEATEVTRTRSSTVLIPAVAANRLRVLGRHLPIGPTRTGGVAVGLALLALAGLIERSRRAARRTAGERIVRRITLTDSASSSTKPDRPAVKPDRSISATTSSRARVPGPRSAALAERQSARTHPATPRDAHLD